MKKKILTILGTRPELIKMFPLIKRLDKNFNNVLVWSGQHYDFELVKKNFLDVRLRSPDLKIKVNKKENIFFQIQTKLYKIIKKIKPDAIIYHGDTFTTLAASIVSNYFFPNILKIHIEGGYRSGDKTQIEERARTTSDQLSDIIYVTRDNEKKNLLKENKKRDIHVVGNTINDAINEILEHTKTKNNILIRKKLKKNNYILITIHRSENVDNFFRLKKIINIINYLSKTYKIFFPIHPRTRKNLKKFNLKLEQEILVSTPTSYSETILLIKNSLFCLTDSGGIQEEAVILKKRCLIPSDKTPHHHYILKGSNSLLNLNKKNYLRQTQNFLKNLKENKLKIFKHKKNSSKLIIKSLKNYL